MTYHLLVGLEFCEIISPNCMNGAQDHSHRRGRKLEKAAVSGSPLRLPVVDGILFSTLHRDVSERISSKGNVKFVSARMTLITR